MPRYEYRCTVCGEDLEVTQSFSDAPLTECPACGGLLRKVFSPVGVVFKGSGFYRTDSRGSNAAAVAKDGAPKDGGGKDSSTKESAASGGGESKGSGSGTGAGSSSGSSEKSSAGGSSSASPSSSPAGAPAA
jgi:putative FmdB family regulatory protein